MHKSSRIPPNRSLNVLKAAHSKCVKGQIVRFCPTFDNEYLFWSQYAVKMFIFVSICLQQYTLLIPVLKPMLFTIIDRDHVTIFQAHWELFHGTGWLSNFGPLPNWQVNLGYFLIDTTHFTLTQARQKLINDGHSGPRFLVNEPGSSL